MSRVTNPPRPSRPQRPVLKSVPRSTPLGTQPQVKRSHLASFHVTVPKSMRDLVSTDVYYSHQGILPSGGTGSCFFQCTVADGKTTIKHATQALPFGKDDKILHDAEGRPIYVDFVGFNKENETVPLCLSPEDYPDDIVHISAQDFEQICEEVHQEVVPTTVISCIPASTTSIPNTPVPTDLVSPTFGGTSTPEAPPVTETIEDDNDTDTEWFDALDTPYQESSKHVESSTLGLWSTASYAKASQTVTDYLQSSEFLEATQLHQTSTQILETIQTLPICPYIPSSRITELTRPLPVVTPSLLPPAQGTSTDSTYTVLNKFVDYGMFAGLAIGLTSLGFCAVASMVTTYYKCREAYRANNPHLPREDGYQRRVNRSIQQGEATHNASQV